MGRWQTVPEEQRYMLRLFEQEFPDDDACLEYVMEQPWPGAVLKCEKCGETRKHYRIRKRLKYCCPVCGNHVSPLAGTIFHQSTTGLKTWFFVIRIMASTRVGGEREAHPARDGRYLQNSVAHDEADSQAHGRENTASGTRRDG
jgi:hypothetical protein